MSSLAATGAAQWYGMNTVSGRMVRTTNAGRTIDPRRLVTRTGLHSVIPCSAAVLGWISTHGAGVWSTR